MEQALPTEQVEYITRRLTPTECARLQGMPDWWMNDIAIANPTPEDITKWKAIWNQWDAINGNKPKTANQVEKWLKNPYTDGAAYKAYGNGMALPCVLYVMEGIRNLVESEE